MPSVLSKKERVLEIESILDYFFPNPPIPLNHSSTYTLLVAVLLSAQCTDERVNQITPELFKLADNPHDMSEKKVEEVEAIIKPCGLFKSKAKHILQLSKILVEKYDGVVPDTLEKLEELPGVGHKTASVVLIQAFKKPAFPVDTHIHRLAKRWKLSSGKNVVQTEKDLKRLFKKENWAKLHLQIIYFARKFCPAKAHNIEKCPICSWI